jgi:hypothetical protein
LQEFSGVLQRGVAKIFFRKRACNTPLQQARKMARFQKEKRPFWAPRGAQFFQPSAHFFSEKNSCNSGPEPGRGAAPQAPRSAGEN